ncbi:6-phosphogluconolactonase [Schaalia suimastitidis]|uniref:6-phosphogluconolactonase n=1 Tax=Schaalia suimastitidis TaxID=121163 RepID=UPI00042163B1|nr:6-phosphogluconolactonase [Schaalia suimastitidis]
MTLHGIAPHHFEIAPTSADLAASVADAFASYICSIDAETIDVAIAGGFVATTVLPALAAHTDAIDWSKIRIWWVDERFVPAGHKDRNDAEAIAQFLFRLPQLRLMPMPTDSGQGLEAARTEFEAVWTREMAGKNLDLALLGMGPDGHFASLFPHDEWLHLGSDAPPVLAVSHSPKPPPLRLSLSLPVIAASREIWLATGGSSKAEAIGAAMTGASPAQWPVAALCAPALLPRLSLFLDQEAASHLTCETSCDAPTAPPDTVAAASKPPLHRP